MYFGSHACTSPNAYHPPGPPCMSPCVCVQVIAAMDALPMDAHPMGVLMTGLCALSTMHPEANPALAGQNVYKSREMQDKQIVRLLGKVRGGGGEGRGGAHAPASTLLFFKHTNTLRVVRASISFCFRK